MTPTVATPTVHLPTSQGFGFAAATTPHPQVPQTSMPQIAPRKYPGMVSWTSPQTGGVTMPPQQPGQPGQPGQMQSIQMPQPATIVQPANQPLPPPTPITTTVSSPAAGLLP
jgi:hypothetical protein